MISISLQCDKCGKEAEMMVEKTTEDTLRDFENLDWRIYSEDGVLCADCASDPEE